MSSFRRPESWAFRQSSKSIPRLALELFGLGDLDRRHVRAKSVQFHLSADPEKKVVRQALADLTSWLISNEVCVYHRSVVAYETV